MATHKPFTIFRRRRQTLRTSQRYPWQCIFCQQRRNALNFSTSSLRRAAGNQHQRDPFGTRLRRALKDTKVEWSPIPVGLGIGFLGLVQFYRTQRRSEAQQQEFRDAEHQEIGEDANGKRERPKKRERIRPSGPWYASREIIVYHTLLTIRVHQGKFKSCPPYH